MVKLPKTRLSVLGLPGRGTWRPGLGQGVVERELIGLGCVGGLELAGYLTFNSRSSAVLSSV